jgi:UDP-MurNAc hydroxylase
MNLTYLGHAGFCVETEQSIVAMDPWFSSSGAFDSAWFQFPKNHHLGPVVAKKLRESGKAKFVYISHEHRDHFDPNFLSSLPQSQITYVVPRFQRAALRSAVSAFNPKAVIVCNDGEAVPIPGGSLKLYLDDSGINRDSAIVVRSGEETFLNLNDCKLYDRLFEIVQNNGPISVLASQFSGATWHPICYDYGRDEYDRISRHKMTSKFESVARSLETIQPRIYLPSAGPACFLDPALIHLNFERVSVFPRAAAFLDYLRRRLPDTTVKSFEIFPGDVVNAHSGQLSADAIERPAEEDLEIYLHAYAAQYRDYFSELQHLRTAEELHLILEQLGSELLHKLNDFTLNHRVPVPLYFGLSDLASPVLRIDFPKRAVEQVPGIIDANYYSIQAPSWQVARIMSGAITWEEFALTFRMRLNRQPDVYQTLIQGFLLMESEDMNWFCSQVLALEEKQKRVVVEAGGTRYSMDRYCPHQGADLCQGWVDGGRLWVCPRHRWQFALDKGGQCLTSDASIHSLCLESD